MNERVVEMRPKIIDIQPMQSMSECRIRFGHCGSSFISTEVHKGVSAKIIAISGSVFQSFSHFRNAYTGIVHLLRLPL